MSGRCGRGAREILRLLQVTGTLDPSYGGPPVVMNQLTRSLLELGHETEGVTLDSPADPWLAECSGEVHALGPSLGRYRYCRRLLPWLRLHANHYDALIVHGIWQYQSFAVRSALRASDVPYFVFTHGALDPWFKRQYPFKHAKKVLYWPWAEYRVLRDASAVLFTCEEERVLARESFGPYRAREAVVGFGIEDPVGDAAGQRSAFLDKYPLLRDKRVLLFLSRIHRKKGCDLLLRAFADASRHDAEIHLVVAGPDQSGWRADLESLARSFGIDERVTWTGMLTGDVKWGAYRVADAFVLPSHSENFGIVVPEALACGLPVLITNKVNIWREIDGSGAGLVENDTVAGATALLRRWLDLSERESNLMRRQARVCFVQYFELRTAARRLAELIARDIGEVHSG